MTEDLVLNVSRLRVLRELAHRGSITSVADALWLTPSAVSQQLSALERETRVQLVERAGRGVRLTAAGKVLAEHSERVFEALDEAGSALRALQSEPTGRLRVASFPSVVRVVLPQVIGRLRDRFPNLRVEVEDREGDQSLEAIRLGHIDVAIIDDLTWNASRRQDGLRRTELFGTPLVVVFAADTPWAERDDVSWSDLRDVPQVAEHRSSVFARSVEEECVRAGFEPQVHARVHDAGAMLALVEGGDMVAVLPELAVLGQPHAIAWRPLVPTVERQLIAATRVGQDQLPAIRELLHELADPSVSAAPSARPPRTARGAPPPRG
jgi:DNA-binding transcriptional LysR family regulator